MKKLTVYMMAVIMSVTFIPTQSQANSVICTTPAKTTEATQADAMLLRLDEINAMDKSNMSFSEKRILHKEVKTIKHHLADIGGGVYLSVGAIVLIVILLIILL